MDSIVEYAFYHAEHSPDKVAVIADNIQLTYAQLWKSSRGFARLLKTSGLRAGDRILVKSFAAVWYTVVCLGSHLAGCICVPLEKSVTAEGILSIANQLTPSLIISDLAINTEIPCLVSSEILEKAAAFFTSSDEISFPKPEEIGDILFTTGTTGKSKGVQQSHRMILSTSENTVCLNQLTKDDVYLIPVSMNHAGAIHKMYASIVAGCTSVLLDGFMNVNKFYQYIENYHVTGILAPPSAIRMLLVLSAKKLACFASQIRFIHTSSEAFPETDKEKLCSILINSALYFTYGSSEAGVVSGFDYSLHTGRINCVGRVLKNSHIFIVNDDHQEIKATRENPGLIAITGKTIMSGYYHEPELTRGVLENGTIYTNDLGYIDEEGYLYMLGRRGDVINLGGLKIAPTEVEDTALRFPGIAECACYATVEANGSKIVRLIYVPDPNTDPDPVQLSEHLKKHLEAFKVPKRIEAVDAIPKTANGKINRKILK